jgi:hypothetical protein
MSARDMPFQAFNHAIETAAADARSIGSRSRFIVNSMFADCSNRQLSISV